MAQMRMKRQGCFAHADTLSKGHRQCICTGLTARRLWRPAGWLPTAAICGHEQTSVLLDAAIRGSDGSATRPAATAWAASAGGPASNSSNRYCAWR